MSETILDGGGSGRLATVNEDFQLDAHTVQVGEGVFANRAGDAYNLNTGFVDLTNATETPLIYLKNNENSDIIIEAVAIGLFNSTSGSSTADVYATFIRNPTVGTIISGASNVSINSNRNYGSAKTLTADAFKGATGDTMTNGDDHILVRLGTGSRSLITINEVLPKGATFGCKIKPPTSNTSMNCYVAIICYLHD